MGDRVFGFGVVRAFSQNVLSPISYGIYQIGYRTSGLVQFIFNIPMVYGKNQLLQEEVYSLYEEILGYEQLKQENQVLREQLNVLGDQVRPQVIGSIVGYDYVGESMSIIIDKGASDGIVVNAIATNGERLVGRVETVGQNHAYIKTIFSVGSKVPARIVTNDDTRPAGLVIGVFNNRIVLTEVLQGVPLKMGDLVVSSGEGGVYPSGLILGRVSEILSSDNEVFQRTRLTPMLELKTLSSVFIEL